MYWYMVILALSGLPKLNTRPRYRFILPQLMNNGIMPPSFLLSLLIIVVTTSGSAFNIIKSSKYHMIVHCLCLRMVGLFITTRIIQIVLNGINQQISRRSTVVPTKMVYRKNPILIHLVPLYPNPPMNPFP